MRSTKRELASVGAFALVPGFGFAPTDEGAGGRRGWQVVSQRSLEGHSKVTRKRLVRERSHEMKDLAALKRRISSPISEGQTGLALLDTTVTGTKAKDLETKLHCLVSKGRQSRERTMAFQKHFSAAVLEEATAAAIRGMKQEAVGLQSKGTNIDPHSLANAEMSIISVFYYASTRNELFSRLGVASPSRHRTPALERAYNYGIAHGLGHLGIRYTTDSQPRAQAA